MRLRDGIPDLTTCVVAALAFVLFVALNVSYNKLGEKRSLELLAHGWAAITGDHARVLWTAGAVAALAASGIAVIYLIPGSY